jgi:4-hydroxy-tetrahydrodipicolinate synthase
MKQVAGNEGSAGRGTGRCRFRGSLVAIVTPFRDGEIDFEAFRALVDWHAESGTDGLVVAGTTGEGATLTNEEKTRLFRAAVEAVRGRMPVVAGIGTNSTRTTVENARAADACGVDGLLVVTPYYNKPTPRGLVLHFSAVAEATKTPIVLYNVPSRTGVDMIPEVVTEVAGRFPHVVAVKEALPSIERVKRLVAETGADVLCGDDASIADFMGLGAVGVIGVVNNVVPRQVAALVRAAAPGGDSARAANLVEEIAPLVRDLFLESNPGPVKAALAMLGRCRDELRLPLATLSEPNRKKLEATVRAFARA